MIKGTHFSKNKIRESTLYGRAGLKITFVGFLINMILVVLKLGGGILGNSRSLVADGIHSFADFLTDIITSLGIYFGNLPPDTCHHYGHKKIETVSEIIMGTILVVVGGGIAISAVRAVYLNKITTPHAITILIAAISFMVKEVLYRITFSVGKHEDSNVVIANAWHHRSDALSSFAVLVGLVVVFFMPFLKVIDAYLGFLVGLLIIVMGTRISWDAFRRIIDTRPPDEFYNMVEIILQQSHYVKHYHNLKMRYIGNEIFIEFHIEVNATMSIYEGHEVSRCLKKEIMSRDKKIYDVLIHIEPEGDHLKRDKVKGEKSSNGGG
ncbi:cation diffusion facilitator family transporter [Candidatus Omnitrophota bacterium]